MARPQRFTEDQFLDAALQLLSEEGVAAATTSAIAEAVGAPVGSLYHRFASRDLLLARLWLRTVERFQAGYLSALAADDLDTAATGAALHVVRWTRSNLPEAKLLLALRPKELIARWPEEVGERLSQLNGRVEQAIAEHAERRFGDARAEHQARVRFAITDLPYAACRRYLWNGTGPPTMMEALVVRTVRAALTDHDADEELSECARGGDGAGSGRNNRAW